MMTLAFTTLIVLKGVKWDTMRLRFVFALLITVVLFAMALDRNDLSLSLFLMRLYAGVSEQASYGALVAKEGKTRRQGKTSRILSFSRGST